MKKERYNTPVVEVIEFDSEDVITTSDGIDNGNVDMPWGGQ